MTSSLENLARAQEMSAQREREMGLEKDKFQQKIDGLQEHIDGLKESKAELVLKMENQKHVIETTTAALNETKAELAAARETLKETEGALAVYVCRPSFVPLS